MGRGFLSGATIWILCCGIRQNISRYWCESGHRSNFSRIADVRHLCEDFNFADQKSLFIKVFEIFTRDLFSHLLPICEIKDHAK